jgi:hypothetical protein
MQNMIAAKRHGAITNVTIFALYWPFRSAGKKNNGRTQR